jgi:hypothetical protein
LQNPLKFDIIASESERNKYIMNKKIKGLLIIFFTTYFYVCALINPVKANDQLVGHVITQVSKGNTEQMVKVLEKEIQAIAYIFAVEFISVLEASLPEILEGIAAEIRVNGIDQAYKCELLKGSGNECK